MRIKQQPWSCEEIDMLCYYVEQDCYSFRDIGRMLDRSQASVWNCWRRLVVKMGE